MNKTIGKWFSLLLLVLVGGVNASAQSLTIEDFAIKAGETKEVTMVYQGEAAMKGYQADITLSEGLTFAEAPAEKDEVFTPSITQKGESYRVVAYSAASATVDGGTEILTISVTAAESFTGGTITLTNQEISFEGSEKVNPSDFTCTVTLDEEAQEETGKFALFTGDLEPGDYVIYYNGFAMNNVIDKNRLQYEEVTVTDNAIVNPSSAIIWTIAADGDYYTLYNAAAESYAASNGTKNQAALATEVSDNARWSVSGSETYEFENVANKAASVNALLRNNGTYGFACYASGTGGTLSLYKKVEEGEVVKPVLTESQNFDSPLTIEITAEDGADIYYTTDGSTPTESSTKYAEPFRVVETTTVNAIAVKGGVTSEVATATYTRVKPILISEAQALDAGSEAYIVGACVASAAYGAVLYDGSDYIYYYNNANDLEVDKYYSVNGTLSSYGGANQFTAAAVVKEHAPADLIIPNDATELTSDHFEAVVADAAAPRQLATFEGTLSISGNYYNLAIEGTENAMGSLVKPKEDISGLNGKVVIVTGYEMYVRGKYVYFVATSVEEKPEVYTYEGTLTQTLSHPEMGLIGESEEDYTITISAPDAEGNVNITYPAGFTFPEMPFVVPENTVVQALRTVNDDGSITYTNESFQVMIPRGQMQVPYNATLTGTQENEEATPTITLTLTNATVDVVVFGPKEEGPDSGTNWTFDENPDDVITVTTQGYERNVEAGSDQISGMQPVTGWTFAEQTESDPGYTGGVFAYGSENLLNNKVSAPAEAPEDSPSALGLAAVWAGIAQYTQPITLEAGNYKYSYYVYNGANTGELEKNLFGFIAEDGTEYLSDKKTFTVGEWELVEVPFTLEEETTGVLSVGFIGKGGSSASPHLFVDYIDLSTISDEEIAKEQLADEIEKAQALADKYVIGDDLFQYPESEIEPLNQAVAAAQAVLDNENSTADELKQALEDLKAFEETFAPQYNKPEEGQPYIFTLNTSEGQFDLDIEDQANKIVEQGEGLAIFFEEQEDGTWALKIDDDEYINYAGNNAWTMTTTADPYGWTITALEDGGCSIAGKNGLYGTNINDGNGAGSPLYGDKNPNNGNYVWNFTPVDIPANIYEGTLTQTHSHPEMGLIGESEEEDYMITISEPDANGMVDITYVAGFTFPEMPFVVPENTVVQALRTVNDDGSITYTNESFTVMIPRGQMQIPYNATLTGTQENEEATPTITLTLSNATTDVVVFGPKDEGLYEINIEEAENGTVESDKDKAREGELITLTVTPDEGYVLENITASYVKVTPSEEPQPFEPTPKAPRRIGDEYDVDTVDVPLTKVDDTTYTFTMPAGDVSVYPTFTISTGVNGVNAGFAATLNDALRNGKVFDVSGRRVNNVVKSGVYIVDGKKVMIRK